MPCDCEDKRWVKWVRVKVENKAICTMCHRDIPPDEIQAEEASEELASLDFKGVISSGNGKTP